MELHSITFPGLPEPYIVVSNTGQEWDTSYSWAFEIYYTKA